jgi:hypothetical protein
MNLISPLFLEFKLHSEMSRFVFLISRFVCVCVCVLYLATTLYV